MNSDKPLYKFEGVSKSYDDQGEGGVAVLSDIDLAINPGETLAILGKSGSGKSTLLHLMGALDAPSKGIIKFEGRDIAKMTPLEQARFRNASLGFVFQFHHLLPEFSALENAAMPGMIAGLAREEALHNAEKMLIRVGLAHRLGHRPAVLSGGERQRVAIARALSLNPRAALADEPTGNLDENTGASIGDLLLELNRELGTTLIVVTHNHDLAARMERNLELRAGVLHEKTRS